MQKGTYLLKKGLAEMLKNGVIMDVVNAQQARIAEKAGACAVMALERVPADIRNAGGVARMADPSKIKEIMNAVTIPVMAKCRIGHFAEARVLEALGVDYIDESEVLTPADDSHIIKSDFKVPFVCGARNLREALRRIEEGAAMIRTKGEAGTGNIIEAVKHVKCIRREIESLQDMTQKQFHEKAKEYGVSFDLIIQTKKLQKLPVVNFAAGGIATPSDAALMILLGCDGIFVGSGIFKSQKPFETAKAIVEAATHFDRPQIIAKVSTGLGEAMKGLDIKKLEIRLHERGN